MTFYNNTVSESGGGIYAEFPRDTFGVDIFNRLCFLQYSDGTGIDYPPQEWTVRLKHTLLVKCKPSVPKFLIMYYSKSFSVYYHQNKLNKINPIAS